MRCSESEGRKKMSHSCDGELKKESKSHNADPEGGVDPIDLNVTANWS